MKPQQSSTPSDSHSAFELLEKARLSAVVNPIYDGGECLRLLTDLRQGNMELAKKLLEQSAHGYREVPDLDVEAYRTKIRDYSKLLRTERKELSRLKSMLPDNLVAIINREVFNRQKDIADILREHVKGQDHVIEKFALVMYVHLLRNNMVSGVTVQGSLPNIVPLLIGETGSGKTFLAETFSKLYDIPSVIFDSNSLSSTGYVGNSPSSIFTMLHQKGVSPSAMEEAIVILDEIDKISDSYSAPGVDIRGRAVQQELLRLLDNKGCEISFSETASQHSPTHIIDISNITFVLSGAFTGIERITLKRMHGNNGLGFSTSSIHNRAEGITDQDIIAYGFMLEFLGRITDIMQLNPVDIDMLINVLENSKSSPVLEYETYFRAHGMPCDFLWDKEWLSEIAHKALQKGLGVRGIHKVLSAELSGRMLEIRS